MKNNIGILGYGQIGKALYKIYKENNIIPKIKDLDIKCNFKDLDILNVCIPFSEKFSKKIIFEIINNKPNITIIHSTVPIGTIRDIEKKLNFKYKIVHSPVRGNHPKLKKSIKTFLKYIGTNDINVGRLVKKHFKKIGIKSKILNSTEHTEAFKLFCTTYYGLCIVWHNEMKKICNFFDLDFDLIRDWNISYNYGYSDIKQKKYNRPILYYSKNNKIGGHCIIPNAKMLNKQFNSTLIEEIIKYE
jgi:UDP-N-acetyl-D-mannosaminuronate dehydrogenase